MAEAEDKSTYGDPRNDKVTAARRRAESPTYAGQCLSRQELGDLVAAHVYGHHGQTLVSDANWVGKLERGEITWPRKPQRLSMQGHPSEAADRLAAAVRGHPASFTRSRAISHTKLAALVMATGDPLEAAAIGSAALATAGTVRSRRLADDLRSLSGYAEPHSAIDEVAALRHQIATTLVGS